MLESRTESFTASRFTRALAMSGESFRLVGGVAETGPNGNVLATADNISSQTVADSMHYPIIVTPAGMVPPRGIVADTYDPEAASLQAIVMRSPQGRAMHASNYAIYATNVIDATEVTDVVQGSMSQRLSRFARFTTTSRGWLSATTRWKWRLRAILRLRSTECSDVLMLTWHELRIGCRGIPNDTPVDDAGQDPGDEEDDKDAETTEPVLGSRV